MLGVCDGNEENLKKNECLLKYFAVKRSTLEACRRIVTQRIAMIFATGITLFTLIHDPINGKPDNFVLYQARDNV